MEHEGKRRQKSGLHDPPQFMRHFSLCVLCASVVNPVDDCHRPELNHRDTENTEKSGGET
ncbi:MAG: hypothetical protein BWX48_02874 [Verrucomicrobia bacterium ADurb.Bin006]|nr:MAG: hypothetical protein BWX48_02874 [Verrucomicrobia bacterium ADurb.Bin006]